MNKHTDTNEQLETAKTEFLQAWALSQEGGEAPNLPAIARRFPHVATELTEWTLNFVAREQILAENTETDAVSELTQRAVANAKNALRERPRTLREAVSRSGLSPFKFATRTRLAPSFMPGLCNGDLTDWPSRLVNDVADALLIPSYQVQSLITDARPAASHFSAQGDPHGTRNTITFRQAIEDALEEEEITPEDAQFWLSELEAEGK